MLKWINKWLIQQRDGVAAVEFALVLPLLLLILFGIINFGTLMYDQAVITNAAREGARWASINSEMDKPSGAPCSSQGVGLSNPCEIANQYARNNLITFGGAVTPTSTFSGYTTSKQLLEVRIQYKFTGIGWFPDIAMGNLNSVARMHHE